jgi:DNA-directed RNA polymerase III subunit RPC1
LANVSNSPLHLSSFEKTSDILYNAAYYGQRDSLAGPSAALILGVPIELGTGLFKLYQETKLDKEKVKKKETLFDHFTQNSSIAVGT